MKEESGGTQQRRSQGRSLTDTRGGQAAGPTFTSTYVARRRHAGTALQCTVHANYSSCCVCKMTDRRTASPANTITTQSNRSNYFIIDMLTTHTMHSLALALFLPRFAGYPWAALSNKSLTNFREIYRRCMPLYMKPLIEIGGQLD